MRRLLLATAFLAAASVPAAAATLFVEVFDGATLVSSTSSASGAASINASNANFSDINVAATGAGIVPNADLSSVTLNVKSLLPGTHVLTVDVFQTGVFAKAGTRLESTFSSNDLIGDPGPTTESTFYNGTSTALGTLAATHTFAAGDIVDSFGPVVTPLGVPLTADAHQYMITFTAPGQSSNDTIQLSTAIPEPGTWFLMLAGAAFIGWLGRKRVSFSRVDSLT